MDGFTAAWVVRKYWAELYMGIPPQFSFHPGVYNDPPPDCTGKDVIIVDFSYKLDVMQQIYAVCNSLTILDHHKTAIDSLEWWINDVEVSRQGKPKDLFAVFDLERSGAMLAWNHFFPDQPAPRFIEYVQDRDLWKFNMPAAREVNAYAFSCEYDFETWDKLMRPELIPDMIVGGAAIERKHHKDIAELVKVCARWAWISNHFVPIASLPYTLTSDAGHLMCKQVEAGILVSSARSQWAQFAACYYDTREHRVFSLRSLDDGADVSLIAKEFGGGGHKHAAGFRVPRNHYLAQV